TLDNSGSGSLAVADVLNAASSDACGIASEVLSQTSFDCSDVGTFDITLTVTDVNSNETQKTISVTVEDNKAPTINCLADQSRPNDFGVCSYTVIDQEFDPANFTDNCPGSTISNNINGTATLAGEVFSEGTTSVTWTVTDATGINTATCSFDVVVNNTAPSIVGITGPQDPIAVDPVSITACVELNAVIDDTNLKYATWFYSIDGVNFSSSGEELISSNNIQKTLCLSPGVYSIKLVVEDHCGETDVLLDEEYVVIYDPSGGFVTGGGWILSPEGAYKEDISLVGRANFGFNAKYKKGKNSVAEVDGSTNFQFKAGDLHFKSSSHDDAQLVISNDFKATYTGVGTINGDSEEFKFRVTVIDAEKTVNHDIDLFRIRIWNEDKGVVYDNNVNTNQSENADPSIAIEGGSIVIHKPTSGKTKTKESTEKTGTQSTQPAAPDNLSSLEVAPNPMVSYTDIRFSLKAQLRADLLIFDMNGKQLRTLFSAVVDANEMKEVRFDRQNLMSGVYICKLVTGDGRSYEKQIIIE
ncbi:T9SS type A sorting domain-containing protein, partial [Christiangramia aquimixticola]|uniref:T9SS type A sorting domain-containing protein n=1 Tax=Christiangramia aquimixticola TaxID=1697558 RepID=UPI003AA84265